MAASARSVGLIFGSLKLTRGNHCKFSPCRWSNTLPVRTVEMHRKSELSQHPEKGTSKSLEMLEEPREYKFIYPEFLPDPVWYKRDRIKEMLEREDMYRRRSVMNIPEFYVGSIVAVTVADKYASGKTNRFVGICISRSHHGLRACMILRNVIDSQGIEIMYEIYSPIIQRIEVLKLEKRLDSELFYLRDAPLEYSTFPFDMDPIHLAKGSTVPVNHLKVKLNPRPWLERWERMSLKGVEDFGLPEKFYKRAKEIAKPWEKYDLMKMYRSSINDVETAEIMMEVEEKQKTFEESKMQKMLSKPKIKKKS